MIIRDGTRRSMAYSGSPLRKGTTSASAPTYGTAVMASPTAMRGTVPTVASARPRTSRAFSVDDDAVCDQGKDVVATNKMPARS